MLVASTATPETKFGQFGKVMAATSPRLAVGYHFFNDFDTTPLVLRDIRRAYDGPLALAVDCMVFNITKDDIKVRMAAVDEDTANEAVRLIEVEYEPQSTNAIFTATLALETNLTTLEIPVKVFHGQLTCFDAEQAAFRAAAMADAAAKAAAAVIHGDKESR